MELREYETRRGVALERDQVTMLSQYLPWLSISPSLEGPFLYDLTADSFVGACEVDGFTLRVLPKFDIANLPLLLGFARSSAQQWLDLTYGFAPAQMVSNLIVPGFLEAAERAFASGVLNGYRTNHEALSAVRGRIDFTAQCQRRFGRLLPVEVVYEDFTADILENRLIRAAVLRLRRLGIRDSQQLQQLRGIESLLEDVQLETFDQHCIPEVHFHRLNERYRDVVQTSRVVLQNATLDLAVGPQRLKSFFVDMNYAFEDYVVRSLRTRLRLSERDFAQGAVGRPLHLDSQRRIRLKPDFAWWHGTRCVAVGDVKYKRPDFRKHQGDLYQIESYLLASGVRSGYLLYADGCAPQDICIANTDKVIKIRGIDLGVAPREIERQIDRLAEQLRTDAGVTPR